MATLRQINASVAVALESPFTSQTHAGTQLLIPTATPRMNRQSVEVGAAPVLTGCPHLPEPGNVVVVVVLAVTHATEVME